MTVDLMKLAKRLKDVEADLGTEITNRRINPYLLENVIVPYLNGEDVRMDSLDFTVFSSLDIMQAMDEIKQVYEYSYKTEQLTNFFRKSMPVARQAKAFC